MKLLTLFLEDRVRLKKRVHAHISKNDGDDHHDWTMYKKKKPIGHGTFKHNQHTTQTISANVHPEHRNKGHYTSLLRAIKAKYKSKVFKHDSSVTPGAKEAHKKASQKKPRQLKEIQHWLTYHTKLKNKGMPANHAFVAAKRREIRIYKLKDAGRLGKKRKAKQLPLPFHKQ